VFTTSSGNLINIFLILVVGSSKSTSIDNKSSFIWSPTPGIKTDRMDKVQEMEISPDNKKEEKMMAPPQQIVERRVLRECQNIQPNVQNADLVTNVKKFTLLVTEAISFLVLPYINLRLITRLCLCVWFLITSMLYYVFYTCTFFEICSRNLIMLLEYFTLAIFSCFNLCIIFIAKKIRK
jgi:hypothetical protein